MHPPGADKMRCQFNLNGRSLLIERESARARDVSAAGAAFLGLLALFLLPACGGVEEEQIRTVTVPTPPAPVVVTDSLRSGQTLGQIFGTHGFNGVEIDRLVRLIREYENPRRFQPGTLVHLAMRPDELPSRVSLNLDLDRTLHLFTSDEGAGWTARLDSVPVYADTAVVGGLVQSNLYNAEMVGDGERLSRADAHDLVYRLSQVFGWQVDFYRDIRPGDAYRVAIERQVRPDGTVRSIRLLAAEYVNAGRSMKAVRFQETEEDQIEYFDADGEALRSQFLRAPLDLVRITSGFNTRRFHPVLRQRRPHLGTDYGARPGTPVRATGAGVVTRSNWWGGYGRVVEIRHANQIRTRYAHLQGFARGIRPGVRVEQGQTIGYVGSSGLATGPHLHYEFLRHGRHVNPARLNLPRAEPVGEEHRERFYQVRDEVLVLLDRVQLPGVMMASASGSGAIEALELTPGADVGLPGRTGDD